MRMGNFKSKIRKRIILLLAIEKGIHWKTAQAVDIFQDPWVPNFKDNQMLYKSICDQLYWMAQRSCIESTEMTIHLAEQRKIDTDL